MRAFFVNLGVLAAALAVGAILVEVLARAFFGLPAPYALPAESTVFDARGFWTGVPGFTARFDNRVDFRDAAVGIDDIGARRVPCAADAGTAMAPVRVFLVGDSQTFGWGLSDADTWANGLQCRLETAAPGRYRVINFGVAGTQVDQYWARGVRQVVPGIRPGDVVVVSVTWNDLVTFNDGLPFVEQVLAQAGLRRDGSGVRQVEPPPPVAGDGQGLALRLLEPRRYLNPPTWRYRFYNDYGVFVPSFDSPKAFADTMTYVSAAFGILWRHARLLYYRLRPADSLAAKLEPHVFEYNFLTLKALQTVMRRRGARMLVQLLPNRLFFDDFYYAAYSKNGVVFPARDFMGSIAADLCPKLELDCVNRFDDLATAARDAHTFPFDGHYNAAGAARVASALAREVRTAP